MHSDALHRRLTREFAFFSAPFIALFLPRATCAEGHNKRKRAISNLKQPDVANGVEGCHSRGIVWAAQGSGLISSPPARNAERKFVLCSFW